jgi:hypothetical protein
MTDRVSRWYRESDALRADDLGGQAMAQASVQACGAATALPGDENRADDRTRPPHAHGDVWTVRHLIRPLHRERVGDDNDRERAG